MLKRLFFNGHVAGLLAASVILLVLKSLQPFFNGSPPLLLFLVAVMLAAWFSGFSAGLLITGLSGLASAYFLVNPEHSFAIADSGDRLRLVFLVSVGVVLSLIIERLRQAERRVLQTVLERKQGLYREVVERRETEKALLDAKRALELEIAERKDAEAVLRQSENLLRLITDTTPAAISYVDCKYRYRWVNETYERWFGEDWAQIRGRRVRDVMGDVAWQHIQPLLDRALSGDTVAFELEVPYQASGTRWISATYTPDTDAEGQVRGVVALVNDIADRKQIEAKLQEQADQLREADRRKNEFLAMLGHELRNPLAPIRNAVKIMRRPDAPDPALHWAREVVDRQVEHLVRLVDDLLDVSRIVQGKLTLQKASVELAALIDQAVETCEPLLDARRHRFVVSIPDQSVRIEGDAVRLAQAVSNLLVNAAKYTPDGGEIWLTATCENGEVLISVRDTGEGISPALLPHLFEVFTQAERTLDRAQGGLGLGLTIVQKIVELHGGHVEAYSEGPGRGSEFVVRLPLDLAAILPENAA
ncbi:sensor histidine kinase [Methylocaldum sp.]|uniref:sensor histidine kinase n=1 Tax=Methylocaldum sp. TaxID=1969727 RepID=UPI002D37E43E|nr:ATP-binding protein [Methylocaldum sp.]HYE33892.1 ATP-binding protein [Methylocaldum sp.]